MDTNRTYESEYIESLYTGNIEDIMDTKNFILTTTRAYTSAYVESLHSVIQTLTSAMKYPHVPGEEKIIMSKALLLLNKEVSSASWMLSDIKELTAEEGDDV